MQLTPTTQKHKYTYVLESTHIDGGSGTTAYLSSINGIVFLLKICRQT